MTGASGYICHYVLNEFLSAGFNVRAQARSEHSAESIRKAHIKYGDALSFTYIKSITDSGAFDEAVKDVNGVIHLASPFMLEAKDFDHDLFELAEKGTRDVLEAVKRFNPNCKRIIITSSFASVVDMSKGLRPDYTYTKAD